MAFRLLRFCSNPATLKLRLKELKSTFLIPRGYKSIEIDTVFSKILDLDRKNALQKIRKHKKEINNDVITVPLTHDPRIPNQGKIIRTHYNAMVINNTHLKEVFKKPPIPALRQTPNLRNLLCKAKLTPIRDTESKNGTGWKNCFTAGLSKRPCKICKFTYDSANVIIGNITNYKHRIKDVKTISGYVIQQSIIDMYCSRFDHNQ